MQVPGGAQVRKSEPPRATENTCPATAFAQDCFSVAQNRPICFQLLLLHFKKGKPYAKRLQETDLFPWCTAAVLNPQELRHVDAKNHEVLPRSAAMIKGQIASDSARASLAEGRVEIFLTRLLAQHRHSVA